MKNLFAGACLVLALLVPGNFSTNADVPVEQFRRAPAAMLNASLKIRAFQAGHQALAYGSGFAISPNLFVTAFHVIDVRKEAKYVSGQFGDPSSGNEDPKPNPKPAPKPSPELPDKQNPVVSDRIEIEVKYPDFKGKVWEIAECVKYDIEHDVAVLKISTSTFPYTIAIGEEGLLQPGDPIWLVGAPARTSPQTATLGYFASTEPEDGSYPYLYETSNACFFGNSGGMVVDANRGGVVGVLVQGRGSGLGGFAPNVSLFVPMKFVKALLVGIM